MKDLCRTSYFIGRTLVAHLWAIIILIQKKKEEQRQNPKSVIRYKIEKIQPTKSAKLWLTKFSLKPIDITHQVNVASQQDSTIQFLKIDTKLGQVKVIWGIHHHKGPKCKSTLLHLFSLIIAKCGAKGLIKLDTSTLGSKNLSILCIKGEQTFRRRDKKEGTQVPSLREKISPIFTQKIPLLTPSNSAGPKSIPFHWATLSVTPLTSSPIWTRNMKITKTQPRSLRPFGLC